MCPMNLKRVPNPVSWCPLIPEPLTLCVCAALQSGLLNTFPFDPLGKNSKEMQLKEIKNGRLAMVRVATPLTPAALVGK